MKGKYANKAEKRREVAAAEEAAAAAQKARVTAETALAEYRTQTERKIARLEERLSMALAERDSVTAPRIAELENQVETMRRRVNDADAKAEVSRQSTAAMFHFAVKLLHNITGCTGLEAGERIYAAVQGLPEAVIADATTGAPNAPAQSLGETKTLQRVRGWRSSPKIIAHLDSLVEAAKGKGE